MRREGRHHTSKESLRRYAIETLLARIQFANDVEAKVDPIPGDGEIIRLPNCRCDGTHVLKFFSEGRLIAEIAYLHGVNLRSPRRDQSGTSDKPLPITKAGNTHLRCLLVNCAHYILGPFGPPTALREAGLRIAARGGKSAKKRAVIATARKFAVTMMALWKTRAEYQPLPRAA